MGKGGNSIISAIGSKIHDVLTADGDLNEKVVCSIGNASLRIVGNTAHGFAEILYSFGENLTLGILFIILFLMCSYKLLP